MANEGQPVRSFSTSSFSTSSYDISNQKTAEEMREEREKRLKEEARKEKEYYDKNFKITTKSEDIYDKFGNFIGTKETTSVGDWVTTETAKDRFGNEFDKETTYKIKY